MKRMKIFAVAAILLCLSAHAEVDRGAPFEVSAPAKFRPQYWAQAAWSSEARVWLVVWQDGDPTEDYTGEGNAQDILAVRVSAEGQVLDAKPIDVARVRAGQQRPRVASDGKDFLVVWHDFRNGKDWGLYAACVKADGQAVANGGVVVAGGAHNQCFPDVAYAGGNYHLAWLDMRHWPEYRIYGGRVSPGGKPMDGDGIQRVRVMNDKELEAWKNAPFAPGKLGKGWHNFGVKGMEGIKQPAPPSLGSDGKTVVIVSEIDSDHPDALVVVAVDGASGKEKAEPQFVANTTNANQPYLHWCRTSVAATGDGFLVADHMASGSWGSGPGTWMTMRLTADGSPGSGTEARFQEVVTLNSKYPPGYRSYSNRHGVLGLAWDGKRGLFVCEQHEHEGPSKAGPGTPGNIDVLAYPIDADGKRIGGEKPVNVAVGAEVQSAPAVCAGPEGHFLVVWQEEVPGKDSHILASLLTVK